MAKMNEEQKEDFIAKYKHEKEEEKKGPLWIELRPHECDMDPNAKSPLASCRNKHPPRPNHENYDLTRPAIS
jgi:hypothetical protein